jgi:hypothetical protein
VAGASAGIVLMIAAGCSGGGDAPTTPTSSADVTPPASDGGSGCGGANLLVNPGFEEGAAPWITLSEASGFEVSAERAQSGSSSAHLRMRDTAEDSGTGGTHSKVYYLVQEIAPAEMPDTICGFFRVENWKRGSRHQYVQFVVIAIAPDNFPTSSPNYQIRYLLAGADSPPFGIGNAKFVFVTREDPPFDTWVPFELPIREDFERLWGAVPGGYEKLRLLFEVRWDNKVAGEATAEADVYYDDLYAGEHD